MGTLAENPTIKINFDASFDNMSYKSALAIVARNGNREIKISKSCLHAAVGTAFDAEAIVCYEAILIGKVPCYAKRQSKMERLRELD